MLFSRQAFPMVWDFVEINPFSEIGGSISKALEIIADSLTGLTEGIAGIVGQQNVATSQFPENILISTDPPYFDNVPYADLSDFFYIWLRRSLSSVYPDLFKTLFVPKSDELVADSFRHGSKVAAEEHFINGIRKAFKSFRTVSNPTYPISIYYAFKQSESEQPSVDDSDINLVSSTGWEVMLQGLVDAGLSITGTWPMRTERSGRMRDTGSNALASSIVMVCRSRADDAIPISRRNFIIILKQELPKALRKLQQGNIAPVDLAQASIGPGMAIFSRYQAVLEANGTPMSIRAALTLINQALDEYLAEQEGEYDGDTRWALAWFEQYGHELGPYGVAETLSKAKNTSVEGLSNAGFLEARAGKVRLLKRDELDEDWDPSKDKRLTAWEAAQYLIRSLDRKGEKGAGALLSKLGSFGEIARDLAYRLYTICERKGWAQEALAYNMLVVAWPRIKEQSGKGPRQESLL